MTRVLSYNILVGGTRRVDQLTEIMRSVQADVIGLAEATDPMVVARLATRLDMDYRLSGKGKGARDWQVAVLSRLPIVRSQVHTDPTIFKRKHFLEVALQLPDGSELTTFVIHQIARFHHGRESNRIRRGEVEEMLRIMTPHKGMPHLVLGDFNSIAPGEALLGSHLLRYAMSQRELVTSNKKAVQDYLSNLNDLSQLRRNLVRSTFRSLIYNKISAGMIDRVSPTFAHGGIDLLLKAGYTDCYRQVNPDSPGFTCPAADPAGRIDYIFASPELAQRLTDSNVVLEGNGVKADAASDHLALYADFL